MQNRMRPPENFFARRPRSPGTTICTMPTMTSASGQNCHHATPMMNLLTNAKTPQNRSRMPKTRAAFAPPECAGSPACTGLPAGVGAAGAGGADAAGAGDVEAADPGDAGAVPCGKDAGGSGGTWPTPR